MKKLFTCLILLLGLNFGKSQSSIIDSLQGVLSSAKEDTNKVNVLNALSQAYYEVDVKKCLKLAQEARILSASLNFRDGLIRSKKSEANAFMANGNYELARKLYAELIDQHKRSGNLQELGRIYNNIARLETNTGNFDLGVSYLIDALKCFDASHDTELKIAVYSNLINNYDERGERQKALKYARLALDECIRTKSKTTGKAYEWVGTTLLGSKQYKEGLENYEKAADFYIAQNDRYSLATLYSNMGYYFIQVDDFIKARLYSHKAISTYSGSYQPDDLITCLTTISDAFFDESRGMEKVREKIYLDSCFFYLDSATAIAERLDLKSFKMQLYRRTYGLHGRRGNWKDAFMNLYWYIGVHDSILSNEKEFQINEIITKYDVEAKEKENIVLASSNKIQKLTIISLSVGVIILVLFAWFLFRQRKLRNEQRQSQLEQKLLRSQMNPHFIFNSLQAIQNYILRNDQKEAVKYLSSFAHITRSVLENSRLDTISLKKEISLLENYLHLQKLRFGERFEYTIHVDPALDTDNIELPPMLSQPFIENALEHGMKEIEKGGKIDIFFSVINDNLLLEIVDNGKGIRLDETTRKHQSLALAITEERIKLMNKTKTKKASFNIVEAFPDDPVRKGVKVLFSIPV